MEQAYTTTEEVEDENHDEESKEPAKNTLKKITSNMGFFMLAKEDGEASSHWIDEKEQNMQVDEVQAATQKENQITTSHSTSVNSALAFSEMTTVVLSGAQELAIVKSAVKTVNQTNEAKVTEIESWKCQLAEKEEDANKNKAIVIQLKKIGRMFKVKKEEATKKMATLVEDNEKLEKEFSAKKASEGPSGSAISPNQAGAETHKLLVRETKKLKAENEELRKTSKSKLEQAKIQKTEKEKRKLELKKIGETISDKSLMDWAGL